MVPLREQPSQLVHLVVREDLVGSLALAEAVRRGAGGRQGGPVEVGVAAHRSIDERRAVTLDEVLEA